VPVADDDPLPALRLAWRALGQPAAALRDSVSVDRILARAMTEFDPSLIPRKHIDFAALHNSVAIERT
jgi:glutamyl-Q tRNA(Asp) synthetase